MRERKKAKQETAKQNTAKQNTAKRKTDIGSLILIAIFFVGLSVLLYPSVSNWWNEKVSTRAISTYDETVAGLSEKDYSAYFEAAADYNRALKEIGSAAALADPGLVSGYEEILDITGTGIMGYVTIEKINVELPIYHGTEESVLQVGAGHLEGSSLPVGGEGTHCVISAHRGLPSALLFTNLDQIEVGDTFVITVLDQAFTYEVDQISIVLPDETEKLYIEEGKDYCTLMTCTPYGINTHRLLVRGIRVAADEETHDAQLRVSADAYKIDSVIVAPFLAVPILVVFLVWLRVRSTF